MKNWKGQFKEEFGIHFSKSELQFVLDFIEELLSNQEDDSNDYWKTRCKEEKIATAEAGEQMCEMRLKKQKEEIEKEVEERISKLEQIRCDEMLEKQKEEMEREIKLWFNMFMVDKSVRIDVRGITCLKDLLSRLRKL